MHRYPFSSSLAALLFLGGTAAPFAMAPTASGFPTAEYRLVFFGKPADIRELSAAYPELIPYLPLTIVVFAEGDDTLVLTTDPLKLGEFFNKPELLKRFAVWEKDVRAIFDEVARNPWGSSEQVGLLSLRAQRSNLISQSIQGLKIASLRSQ